MEGIEFYSGRIRFHFDTERGKLFIRVTGESEEPGTEAELDRMANLEKILALGGINFEAFPRDWKSGKRTDCIALGLNKNKPGIVAGYRTCCD